MCRTVELWKGYLLEIIARVNIITLSQTISKNGKHKSSPYFKGTVLWKSLPDNVVTLPTLIEFNRFMKRHFSWFNEDLL